MYDITKTLGLTLPKLITRSSKSLPKIIPVHCNRYVTIVLARKILLRSSLLVRKKVGKQNQKMLVHYMYVAAAVVSLWKSLNEICSHVCNCCITKLLLFLVFYSFIITYFSIFLQSNQPDRYRETTIHSGFRVQIIETL